MSPCPPNGQVMSYSYNAFGRLSKVRSPYDTGSVPAVSYQYETTSLPWSVLTTNKLLYDPSDARTIQTLVQIDGLGRALQSHMAC